MATVADFIVTSLQDAGVRALFGVPGGGGNLDLIAAANRHDLPFVLTATETASAIAAGAQAEITGRPGACLTTIGPGAASVVNGVACALLERTPLVVLTDSYGADTNPGASHQRIDHGALLGPVTKWSASLTADGVFETLARAWTAMIGPPPGPVHLDCPGSVGSATTSGAPELRSPLGPPSRPHVSTSADIRQLISSAQCPVVIAGLGARGDEDARTIRSFCERRHVPALVTYKAKGVVPDTHAWFGGVFTNGAIERPIVGESDLIIGVGLDPVELLPRPWPYSIPAVYCGPWSVDARHVPFAAQLVTGISSALEYIERDLPSSTWRADVVCRHAAEPRRKVLEPGGGFTAQRVVRTAASLLAGAGRVTVDAGAHMLPATLLWPIDEPSGLLISNGLSTMGYALPAAVGAALLDRDRPVVALTGDGGLLMCAGELLTAVRERLRIIVIVFNDASLSLIEIKQQARRLDPAGVALGDVNWARVADGFGVRSFVATTEVELEQAITQARGVGGPALIEARIDRSNYAATLQAIRG
jgi:acetolactate synthase-1/2/3 large subunit